MELLLLILLLLVALYSLFSMFKPKTTTRKLPFPPGSTGWPFIGETIEYHLMAKKGCIEKFIKDRVKKYSSKLFRTSYLGENMVFLCNAEGNQFLFSNENKLFMNPWLPRFYENLVTESGKTTLAEEFMAMRKLSGAFTEPSRLKSYVEIMDAATKRHLQKYWDCKEEVKVYSLVKYFTFSLACQLILNIQDEETTDELQELADCIITEFFILPLNMPGTKCHRIVSATKEFLKKLEAIVKQKKREMSESESQDMLSQLLQEKNEGKELSEYEIVRKLNSLLIAVYDNPSSTLVTIINYLAELPQIYEEVLREQMEIVNSKGPEELLTFEDTKKMKYTWNVICEVLRLEPPNSGTFREATTDINYNGYTIPKGWKLHWAPHATHRNPEYFKDPEKFDPLRFERNEIVPFSYVPFGGGTHICPGKEFARLQLLVFVHNLIKKFRWEKVLPDEKMIRNPNLKPEHGLSIRLYHHDP